MFKNGNTDRTPINIRSLYASDLVILVNIVQQHNFASELIDYIAS